MKTKTEPKRTSLAAPVAILDAKQLKAARPILRQPPAFVVPMKPSPVKRLPEGPQWSYEIKWDGYRALALKDGDSARLLSFTNHDLSSEFAKLTEAVTTINAGTALLDGEIVAVDPYGKASFQALQDKASLPRGYTIAYYAFDLLNLEGEDISRHPLSSRREKLKKLLKGSGLRFSAELIGSAEAVESAVRGAALEGIVAKRRDSIYRPGGHGDAWVKLKLDASQEFVIGGYELQDDGVQSLLVGYYDKDKLVFYGRVRQGFTPAMRLSLAKALQGVASTKSPFSNLPKAGKAPEGSGAEEIGKPKWLKPKLVAQCSFTEYTSYGPIRHGTFLGLRQDKDPREVRKE